MKSNKLDAQRKVTLIKIMKSYLKVIPFYLWVKQFCRASNSLKIPINIKQQVFPTPATSTLGFQTMKTLTKPTCTQVKQAPARRNECNQGFKLISLKFLLQKDTRFCSQTQNKMQQTKNYKVMTNILSFTFLEPAHGSNIILPDCRFILQSKNLFCHHVCRYPVPQYKNKY